MNDTDTSHTGAQAPVSLRYIGGHSESHRDWECIDMSDLLGMDDELRERTLRKAERFLRKVNASPAFTMIIRDEFDGIPQLRIDASRRQAKGKPECPLPLSFPYPVLTFAQLHSAAEIDHRLPSLVWLEIDHRLRCLRSQRRARHLQSIDPFGCVLL